MSAVDDVSRNLIVHSQVGEVANGCVSVRPKFSLAKLAELKIFF